MFETNRPVSLRFRWLYPARVAWTQDRVSKLYERVALAIERARHVTEHATALGAVGQPGKKHTAEGDGATERGARRSGRRRVTQLDELVERRGNCKWEGPSPPLDVSLSHSSCVQSSEGAMRSVVRWPRKTQEPGPRLSDS